MTTLEHQYRPAPSVLDAFTVSAIHCGARKGDPVYGNHDLYLVTLRRVKLNGYTNGFDHYFRQPSGRPAPTVAEVVRNMVRLAALAGLDRAGACAALGIPADSLAGRAAFTSAQHAGRQASALLTEHELAELQAWAEQ